MGEWLFLAVPWGYLRFVIVVYPDHTHLLFLYRIYVIGYMSRKNVLPQVFSSSVLSFLLLEIIDIIFKNYSL